MKKTLLLAEILAAAPEAPIVVREFADSFVQTHSEQILRQRGVTELLVWGRMTQNCVTHTAMQAAPRTL
jgi:nicotinamidase-related amidase